MSQHDKVNRESARKLWREIAEKHAFAYDPEYVNEGALDALLAFAAAIAPRSAALTREEAAEAAKAIRSGMNPATPAMFFPQGWNVILDKLDAIAIGAPMSSERAQLLEDALDDVKRLHAEKMKFFERTIELERQLAAVSATSPHKALLIEARAELRVIASYADDEKTPVGLRVTAKAYQRVIAKIDALIGETEGRGA